jgi:nitroreductase
MKKIALLIVSCLAFGAAVSPLAAKEGTNVKDTFSVIHSRKSVRSFTGKPVDRAALEKIVRAGMAAPTAVNRQPWSFVIVTDKGKLEQLAAGLPYAKMLSRAGAAIIVCSDPREAFDGSREFAVIDASLAGENILLAIEALGLGGVWTAAYPDQDRMKLVRGALGIPQDVMPLSVIPVGEPTGEDKPKDKFKQEKIHWEAW